jgi:hypothetical protein
MTDSPSATPLRTLFCVGNNQNFFDLPKDDIGKVWIATQTLPHPAP